MCEVKIILRWETWFETRSSRDNAARDSPSPLRSFANVAHSCGAGLGAVSPRRSTQTHGTHWRVNCRAIH